jgi:hypothetical protein
MSEVPLKRVRRKEVKRDRDVYLRLSKSALSKKYL